MISFNLWITPDDANLNTDTGGLIIYPVKKPQHWDILDTNKIERVESIRQYLREKKLKNGIDGINIPYKANRAIIFDSRLFHESGPMHFKKGYKNRRINLTFHFK